MRFTAVIGVGCAALVFATAAQSQEPKVLNWIYDCQTGGSFGAQFIVGGDQATLWLPGQPALTLKQMMSADGARYGDQTYEFFTKGRGGYLNKGGVKFGDNCVASLPAPVTPDATPFSEADSGKAIQLSIGQSAHFNMPVQAGTGFSWEAHPNGPDLQIQIGKPTPAAKPGGPSMVDIGAKANKTGFLVLEFRYARPWEKGTPPAKVVRFPILITE